MDLVTNTDRFSQEVRSKITTQEIFSDSKVIDQKITEDYAIYNGDCNAVMKSFPDNSIHLSVYSPPFGGLYNYSSDVRDLSNCHDYEQFFEHYAFTVSQISRITVPGRITAVHCTDIPSGNSGYDYLNDFPGDIIRLHEKYGFKYIARHVIWKEPLWVRNRTMSKSLAHKTIVDDSAYAGVASADYMLIFRKNGQNKIPIAHPTGFEYYAGECPIPKDILKYRNYEGDQKLNKYSHWIWRRYASSIWDDINMTNVLPFIPSNDGSDQEEKHVHPLQLDIIDRVILIRSNPGDKVLTPFMGIGSEAYCAVRHKRKAIGIELKSAYYKQAIKNLSIDFSKIRTTEQYSLELEFNF